MTMNAFLIIPAPYKSGANAVGAAMGWGPNNYDGIALSNTDGETITHWACLTDVQPSFLVILLAAGYDLKRVGMTPEEITVYQSQLDEMIDKPVIPEGASIVLSALDVNLSQTLWGVEHMNSVMETKHFTRVQ